MLYTLYYGLISGDAMEDLLPTEILKVEEGFYWVKYRSGCRWEPAEFDGVIWHIGDGSGFDLYLVGPRALPPAH